VLRSSIIKNSLLLVIFNLITVFSQSSGVPLTHWGYDAVERWEIRGFLPAVFNGSKPYTRIEMAGYVAEVWKFYQQQPEQFSGTDLDQLLYLTLEFKEELDRSEEFNHPDQFDYWNPRLYYLFQKTPLKILNSYIYTNYRNMISLQYREFKLEADPILSYSIQQKMDESEGKYQLLRISNGLMFRGELGKYFGFYFDLTDNHLADERWQGEKIPFQVWEESGWPFLTSRDNGDFDFDENVAYLTFHYKYFYLVFGREFNQWGVGHSGNLLLSTNAQLYDEVKLLIQYWRFKFTHLTAFLQYISPEGRTSMKSQPHIDQYWSGNRLELNLGRGVQLGLSEAVVYGDRSLQLGYLNPFSFFKSAEHYYGDRDNGALGVDLEWRIRNGIKWLGEWFIDDITTTKLGSDWYGNKFGWQTGLFFVNPFSLRDIDLLLEYTRIKPYVYSHSYQDYNKYKHYDTILGHYIGPNSDLLLVRFRKRFSKFLQAGLEYQLYRHGSNPDDRNVGGDPDHPWENGDAIDATFLDGIQYKQQTYGISLQYEFIRNLLAEFHYRRMKYHQMAWEDLFSFRISFNLGYRDEGIRHIFPLVN
jgi:hypothetical protein